MQQHPADETCLARAGCGGRWTEGRGIGARRSNARHTHTHQKRCETMSTCGLPRAEDHSSTSATLQVGGGGGGGDVNVAAVVEWQAWRHPRTTW